MALTVCSNTAFSLSSYMETVASDLNSDAVGSRLDDVAECDLNSDSV